MRRVAVPVFPSGKLQRSDAKAHRVLWVQGGKLFQHQLGEVGLVWRGNGGGHPGIHSPSGCGLVVFNNGGYRVFVTSVAAAGGWF